MSLKVTGDMKIHKRTLKKSNGDEYYVYSTSVSNSFNGQTRFTNFPVRFMRGVIVDDKSVITVKKGFLSFFKDKEGKDEIFLMVTDFEGGIAEDASYDEQEFV